MSLQKKNVIQGFIQDDFVPTGDQQIVRYLSGKGNNLHEVSCPEGGTFLVSMPKKYRGTVWLKRGDCLVIAPIPEGKKVRGEIVGLLSPPAVLRLIASAQWGSSALLPFFTDTKEPSKDDPYPWPSSSEEEDEEED